MIGDGRFGVDGSKKNDPVDYFVDTPRIGVVNQNYYFTAIFNFNFRRS